MTKNPLLERMLTHPPIPTHANGFIWTKSRHPRAIAEAPKPEKKGSRTKRNRRG